MILVDTSVWVEHLRAGKSALISALESGSVSTHPFVIGELACGNLANRREVLQLLRRLPSAPAATDSEILAFIEARALMGRGISYVDVHVLAAAVLAGDTHLWTLDKRLSGVAAEIGVAHGGNG